jgi:hypothetical protein
MSKEDPTGGLEDTLKKLFFGLGAAAAMPALSGVTGGEVAETIAVPAAVASGLNRGGLGE